MNVSSTPDTISFTRNIILKLYFINVWIKDSRSPPVNNKHFSNFKNTVISKCFN